ncbi:hyaluronan synthase 1-like [Ambystoma mexicanum]|uniref:hyaluronan synthase 1-like n=1 Tax=Ambystoma mexicanum TaxID=8296 RepID=UPI0037E74D06
MVVVKEDIAHSEENKTSIDGPPSGKEEPAKGTGMPKSSPISFARCIVTIIMAVALLSGILAAYTMEFQITHDRFRLTSFGLYGAIQVLHLVVQSFFAYLEHREMRRNILTCSGKRKVALTISAYQEDPRYLRQCLLSASSIQYSQTCLKIIMVVDGNSKDDLYMLDMFKDVFKEEKDLGTYVWNGNYHSTWSGARAEKTGALTMVENHRHGRGEVPHTDVQQEDPGKAIVEDLIQNKRCVCIMQKWGGKREVMYTAFKALGNTVDFIQVCDSDTKLDRQATMEMVKVLESNEHYGAVAGDVRILNLSDSALSFMSSLRYWMAFNVERACQSYFNCVSCISGPIGLYRNDLLQMFLESWYHQVFLGTQCTFGDDRHLTNRMLSLGYGTKYTAKSVCYSETPTQYLRWMNQQTRWTKSFFREWTYNALWWNKHHPWMTYEAIVSGVFPFLVTVTVVKIFYTGGLWHILWVLLCIQIMGLVKAIYACFLRWDLIMIFMSLYSFLYMTSLLPIKYFAILTINKTNWGTSGRKKMVGNYIALLPLSIWWLTLLIGFFYSFTKDIGRDWNAPPQKEEKLYLLVGSLAYMLYFVFMVLLYNIWIRRCCRKRSEIYNLSHEITDNPHGIFVKTPSMGLYGPGHEVMTNV